MNGIILTQSVGGSGSDANTPIEVTIAPAATEIINVYDASVCPFITWKVSITDMVSFTTTTRFLTIDALHDFEGNADFNCHSIMGVEFDIEIDVDTGTPNTNLVLSITNNTSIDLEICVIRLF